MDPHKEFGSDSAPASSSSSDWVDVVVEAEEKPETVATVAEEKADASSDISVLLKHIRSQIVQPPVAVAIADADADGDSPMPHVDSQPPPTDEPQPDTEAIAADVSSEVHTEERIDTDVAMDGSSAVGQSDAAAVGDMSAIGGVPVVSEVSVIGDATATDAEMSEADRAAIEALLAMDETENSMASAVAVAAAATGTGVDMAFGAVDSGGSFGGDTVTHIIDERTFALGASQMTYMDSGGEALYNIFPPFRVPEPYLEMLKSEATATRDFVVESKVPESHSSSAMEVTSPPIADVPMAAIKIKSEKETDDTLLAVQLPLPKTEDLVLDGDGFVTVQPVAGARLLEARALIELKALVWGSMGQPSDILRWFAQGFGWVPLDEMRFGLLQLYGGPCGVLATVQAYVIRRLLFADPIVTDAVSATASQLIGDVAATMMLAVREDVFTETGSDVPIQPTNGQRSEALVWALSRIIFKCALDKTKLHLVVSMNGEHLWFKVLANIFELRSAIGSHLALLQSRTGVVAFLFSVILSRSGRQIGSEVDDSTQPLVLPEFGHCSQELVNLLVTGRAVSNTHDGDKRIGDGDSVLTLKGIGPNQEIGFLSSLEVLKYVKVGEHLKTPLAPIWLVGSSSHYSVMFALNPAVGKVSASDSELAEVRRQFDTLDPMETGFVAFTKMEDLFKLIPAANGWNKWSMRSQLDPDTTGVVVWSNLLKAYLQSKRSADLRWQCSRCTLLNPFTKFSCQLCYAAKGLNPTVMEDPESKRRREEAEAKATAAPRQFDMYHFNGLRQTKKDRPLLTKMQVLDESEMVSAATCYSEELTALVRTKWPYALVEWQGAFQPKIQ